MYKRLISLTAIHGFVRVKTAPSIIILVMAITLSSWSSSHLICCQAFLTTSNNFVQSSPRLSTTPSSTCIGSTVNPERKNPDEAKKNKNKRKNNNERPSTPTIIKSPESNFWLSIPQSASNLEREEDGEHGLLPLPAIPKIDRETGPLPPGSYQTIEHRDNGRDALSKCFIGVGINPPLPSSGSASYGQDGREVWKVGVRNAQKMMDSGFTTFRVNNLPKNYIRSNNSNKSSNAEQGKKPSKSKSPLTIAMEKQQQQTFQMATRHEAETNFYSALRLNTPSSILRTCNFMTQLEVPSILSSPADGYPYSGGKRYEEELSVPYGNGWMVRESVSDALMRVKGECLDTVILEYRENSPYHLDVLNTLSEMKEEGLLRSISTQNFPPALLRSALGCGFEIRSNDIHGSVLNTCNLQPNGELSILCQEWEGCSRQISGPLGGGLLTDQFSLQLLGDDLSCWSPKRINQCKELLRENARGVGYGTRSEREEKFKSIMTTLEEMALRYQASISSVALRFLLQLNHSSTGDSLVVGTSLGMDFIEEQGGKPYRRDRDLRQVFTFLLEEEDIERISSVSGISSGVIGNDDQVIDFSNQSLWL